jgi:hypothetical protein
MLRLSTSHRCVRQCSHLLLCCCRGLAAVAGSTRTVGAQLATEAETRLQVRSGVPLCCATYNMLGVAAQSAGVQDYSASAPQTLGQQAYDFLEAPHGKVWGAVHAVGGASARQVPGFQSSFEAHGGRQTTEV